MQTPAGFAVEGGRAVLKNFFEAALNHSTFYIGIPKMLSFLVDFDFDSTIPGLNEFPPDERSPVFLPFVFYHVMILLGTLFVLIGLIGAYLLFKNKLWQSRWFLSVLVFAIPLPQLANQFGWIAAEVGRHPWVVYKVMRTTDAASVVVPAGQILFSIIMFTLIYIRLGVVFVKILTRIVKKGPVESVVSES